MERIKRMNSEEQNERLKKDRMDSFFKLDPRQFGDTDPKIMKDLIKKAQAEKGTMPERQYHRYWTLIIRKILGSQNRS
jgi:hypothetical protein